MAFALPEALQRLYTLICTHIGYTKKKIKITPPNCDISKYIYNTRYGSESRAQIFASVRSRHPTNENPLWLASCLPACLIPICRRAFYIHSEKPPASCSQIQTWPSSWLWNNLVSLRTAPACFTPFHLVNSSGAGNFMALASGLRGAHFSNGIWNATSKREDF